MRTTLNISDDLYTAAKVEAARRGETVTSVIEQALRQMLTAAELRPDAPFPVSKRRGGLRDGVNLEDPDQMYELLYGSTDRIATGAQGRG